MLKLHPQNHHHGAAIREHLQGYSLGGRLLGTIMGNSTGMLWEARENWGCGSCPGRAGADANPEQ